MLLENITIKRGRNLSVTVKGCEKSRWNEHDIVIICIPLFLRRLFIISHAVEIDLDLSGFSSDRAGSGLEIVLAIIIFGRVRASDVSASFMIVKSQVTSLFYIWQSTKILLPGQFFYKQKIILLILFCFCY